jgi:hypothetical protein
MHEEGKDPPRSLSSFLAPRATARKPSSGVIARWWRRTAALTALGMVMSGCGITAYSSHDLHLEADGDTLYLFTRNDGVSRNLCATLGGDVTRVEGRLASAEGKTIQIGRVRGCYTVRHVIVCSDGDAACLAHEERHKHEGAFHR